MQHHVAPIPPGFAAQLGRIVTALTLAYRAADEQQLMDATAEAEQAWQAAFRLITARAGLCAPAVLEVGHADYE